MNNQEKVQSNKTSFIIKILFTNNHTWQGEITWVEENKTLPFRSELEMLKLMDSAMDINKEEKMEW